MPAFKGVPGHEVFRFAHHMLRRALCERDSCVVIGYSFRDDYINSLFYDAMQSNPRLRVLLVEPDMEAWYSIFRSMSDAGMDMNRVLRLRQSLSTECISRDIEVALKKLHTASPGDGDLLPIGCESTDSVSSARV